MSLSENTVSSFLPVIDNLTEGILILNKKHQIIFTSNFLNSLIGFSKEELLEKSLEDLLPENKTDLQSIFDETKNQGSVTIQTSLKRKDGLSFIARIRFIKNTEKNSDMYFFLYIKDNTFYQRTRKDILRKALTVEHLSKSRKVRDGNLNDSIYEILEMASRAMDTQRVNAWLFDEHHTQIHCIGNFDSIQNRLVDQTDLPRIAMPNYFKLFETEKMIVTTDALHDEKTNELVEMYLRPHNIHSMLDIPVRIEGEMVGVVCFEHTRTIREWNLQEQKFGLMIAQMISLALEASEKQKIRNDLEIAIAEQKVLLQEVHHRVKNNLTIISSSLNLQANKAKDEFHQNLFYDSRNRLNSIATVHQLLYQSKSYTKVNFKEYLENILDNLHRSFAASNEHIKITTGITAVDLDVSTAIPLALIVNELVTNSYKHAFNGLENGVIEVSLIENNKTIFLKIKDNGPGFDSENNPESSVGLDILYGLVDQINATLSYDNRSGSTYMISFKKV